MRMDSEDAGKMDFARNIGMPGSMAGEIEVLIRAALF
jgi:hypothetical protein